LYLKDITLVCFETRNIEAAIESMRFSLTKVEFQKSILFTTENLCTNEIIIKAQKLNIRLEVISNISSISEYSYFILSKLSKYIETKFCLVTQWDSWIIDVNYWDPKFLNYDYIGALWPHYKENQVGNGGFSLRSKDLLESAKRLIEENPDYQIPLIEDDYICREKRSYLEKNFNIKFASAYIANKFSCEGNGTPINCFGFHSMNNFNFVMQDNSKLIQFLSILSNYHFSNRASYDLAKNLIKENRLDVAKFIIRKRLNSNGLSKKHLKLFLFFCIKICSNKLSKKYQKKDFN
jgi:hypothetical protein